MSNEVSLRRQETFKVTDVIAHVLSLNGVRLVFGVSGGAALHLMHSIKMRPEIELVTTHHEQAAAMAAEATSRISSSMGVAVATSGPGATNLITGIAGAFYDSVPVLFITGQVSTSRLSGASGVRQLGFQETPIVEMVEKITKYAVQVTNPDLIISELEKCIQMAISGRPGPTLLDIPDDLQRMEINLPAGLPTSPVQPKINSSYEMPDQQVLERLASLVSTAKRPVVVLGWGVHLSKQEEVIRKFLDSLGWPTLLTWGAADFLEADCNYRIGTFGTHGNRDANFIIQNSDLIISIGARLDTKSTGSPASSFARSAKVVMIDADKYEIDKFENLLRNIDLGINFDLRSAHLPHLLNFIRTAAAQFSNDWSEYIQNVKSKLERDFTGGTSQFVDPYQFVVTLSKKSTSNVNLFVDTGCAIAWTSQAWEFKRGQRLYHDFNNTAMGWALPASIASLLSENGDVQTYSIIGDGSFMMSIQELATARGINKPLKIFLLNNSGYSMIRQTQDQWFESNYFASAEGSGMNFPNYLKIAEAYSFDYVLLSGHDNLDEIIESVVNSSSSIICEVQISPNSRVIPQVKFGSPIEGMEPPISSVLQDELMIVDL